MDKTTYGILTFLLNGSGLPSFLNGNTKKGVCVILSGVVTCGVVCVINTVRGIFMGLKILRLTDEEFAAADKTAFEDVINFFNCN